MSHNPSSSNRTQYRMSVAYDGTDFSGWQVQPNGISIQGSIERALAIVSRESVRVVGAGRTDGGVHARGQVAHCYLERELPPKVIHRSLNGLLPPSIRILSVEYAPEGFHAQRSALRKEYHYHICFGDIVLPFDQRYVWHCRKRVDRALLREASSKFVGQHDFRGYANAPGHGLEVRSSVRHIFRLDVIEEGELVRLEFEGSGFLYKMVRNITGMVVAVASGRRTLSDIDEVFILRDRRRAEPAAPPQGLVLMRVDYPSNAR